MDTLQVSLALFLLGLTLGSFFNSLVWRLYAMESIGGRSRCPECRHILPWRDTVPLISWWLLGRECRYCRKPVSWKYPAIELLTAVTFVLVGPHPFELLVASVLIFTIASDAKYKIIYDVVLLPSIIIVFAWRFMMGGNFFDMFLGALFGLIFFGSQYIIFNGTWIGFGDVKLALFLGIVFGWKALAAIIVIAYVLGTVTSIVMLVKGQKTLRGTLPLGVFLGTAGLYILICGTGPLEKLLRLT